MSWSSIKAYEEDGKPGEAGKGNRDMVIIIYRFLKKARKELSCAAVGEGNKKNVSLLCPP